MADQNPMDPKFAKHSHQDSPHQEPSRQEPSRQESSRNESPGAELPRSGPLGHEPGSVAGSSAASPTAQTDTLREGTGGLVASVAATGAPSTNGQSRQDSRYREDGRHRKETDEAGTRGQLKEFGIDTDRMQSAALTEVRAVRDAVLDEVDARPMRTLATAAAIGFVTGWMVAR